MLLMLSDPAAADVRRTGAKAGRLASLSAKGFCVPEGAVVTTDTFLAVAERLGPGATPESVAAEPLPADVEQALRAAVRPGGCLHGSRVAVRSSAVAEDLAGASFAGQYETFLDLADEDAIVDSVRRCFASAYTARVEAYKNAHRGLPAGMAVLVQRFIEADAAGVAFTAHPITGERSLVVVSAVKGVGETLVSGHANAEEWEIRGRRAVRRRSVVPVLNEPTALAVADLARRVEADAGSPQDIEWASVNGGVLLLQARPMTALPDPVRWEPPLPGAWVRHFRLGEWLGDPVTPLFESWLLSRLEARFAQNIAAVFGLAIPEPQHVVVNGWYFYGLPSPSRREVLRRLPIVLWRVLTHFRQAAAMMPPLAHLGYEAEYRRWRERLLPRYAQAVSSAEQRVDRADPSHLIATIDTLSDHVGEQFTSIVGVAGFAAKAELPLARFWREHLAHLDGSCFHLVRGIEQVEVNDHSVQGLDWYLPTLGEMHRGPVGPDAASRTNVAAERDRIETTAREALAERPKLLRTFDRLVAIARRAHAGREAQTGHFTIAWPVLRRAIHRLGTLLADREIIASPEDAFFLRRDELVAAVDEAGDRVDRHQLHTTVAERRANWTRQRGLTPPLILGELEGIWKQGFREVEEMIHGSRKSAENEIRGMPGSPGRVAGRVRVLLRLEELDRLQPGEILVAPVTTPGWTPAFAKAAAIVTDTGSLASHASIVAREYGIPAVVATENATARLSDGQTITVDGSQGIVLVEA